MGQGNQYQFQGAAPTPSTSQTGHISQGQSVGRGRAQDLQAMSSGKAGPMMCYHCCQPRHMRRDCPRRQRPHGIEAEHTCDAPNPGCPLTTRQPAENLYVSYRETHT